MNIAIDGPAGAGKSTIAKRLAEELHIIYVDTGAMYRTIALYLIGNNVDMSDESAVGAVLDDISVGIEYRDNSMHIFLNGKDVTTEIRNEAVGNAASKTSAYPAVRKKLLALQRNLASENDCVMDGRDIGSFILPNAEVKIFLTASVEARTKRRYEELLAKGENPVIDEIREGITLRDAQDMNREISPLVQAEDAYYLDSSDMTIDEVVEKIRQIAVGKGVLTA